MVHTVLISGASSGIGKAAALFFAAQGCRLGLCAHSNSEGLSAAVSEAQALGAACFGMLGDVADYEFCARFAAAAVSRYGQLDCLINNAGVDYVGLFQDMKPQDWDRILRVNLYGVLNLSHAALPHMLHLHRGSIVNISSVWGNVGASCEAVYSASKGGINSFTRALAKELAPSGIRVNAVSCGAIDTPMNAWLTPEEKQALLNEIPAGRMGKPDEAAQLIWQIAQGPDYLTGQVITLDGAWL